MGGEVGLLSDTFGFETIRRGRELLALGAVKDCTTLDLDGTVAVFGEVEDAAPGSHQVYAMLENDRASGDCTCPAGADCEHVVALLLRATGNAPAPTFGERKERKRARTASPPQRGVSDRRKARMVYLVDRMPGDQHLSVCAARASAGTPATLTPYTLDRARQSRQPAYVTDEDIAILEQLAERAFGVTVWRNLPGDAGDLLADMIATGRCHWQNLQGPILHEGEPLVAALAWRVLDNGDQRLEFDFPTPDGFQPLPIHPTRLLNPATGECRAPRPRSGRALAAELMEEEDIAPGEVHAIIRRIESAQAGPAFPHPCRLALRRIEVDRPTPRLSLGRLELEVGTGLRCLPMARLRFDYDGAMFDWDNLDTSTLAGGDTVIEVKRNDRYESLCADRLSDHGLVPVFERLDPEMLQAPAERGCWIAEDPLAAIETWVRLQRRLPQWRKDGWNIEIDSVFPARLVEPDDWYAELIAAGDDRFELDLGIELDGQRISLLAAWLGWLEAVSPDRLHFMLDATGAGHGPLLRMDEHRLVFMPREHLRAAIHALGELVDSPPKLEDGRLRLARSRLGEIAELGRHWTLRDDGALGDLAERLAGFTEIEPVTLPAGLGATLRPYQQAGLDWLQFLRVYGFGGILADDMGLGKTVQTLAHLLVEKQSGRMDRPALVIAPTSLVFNWRAEARRFAPGLSVLVLHGPNRKLRFHEIPAHDLVLTTYPLIARDIEKLDAHRYHLLILDEAQTIKNPRAGLGRLIRRLKARHRLCLTGTPLENHLGELWSLFDFLMPGLLGDMKHFKRAFQAPIERERDEQRREILARRIKPFFLRRTKQEVAPELPAKNNITRTVALTEKQRKLYETVRVAMHDKVRRALDEHGAEKSRIIVLDALLKLRQICCDPRLPKSVEIGQGAGSAKLELLLGMLPELLAEGRRVLLFSQFVGMLDLIVPELKKRAIDHVMLTGRTRDRQRAVERFQQGRVPLFLISLKAGGVGLNLTAADTVIHYDPWWNPAVEDQATDRAHRIGQRQKVFVYRLLTENTVEERVDELQRKKRGLIEGLLGDGGARTLAAGDLEVLFGT